MRALIGFAFSCHGYKSYAHISCIHYPNGSQATDNRSQSTDLHWKCAALVMWRLALELLSAGAGLSHVWNKVIPSLSFVLVTKDVYSMRNWLGSKTHSGASCWPHCDIGFIHFRRHCIWRSDTDESHESSDFPTAYATTLVPTRGRSSNRRGGRVRQNNPSPHYSTTRPGRNTINWRRQDNVPQIHPFTETPGLRVHLSMESTPLEIFTSLLMSPWWNFMAACASSNSTLASVPGLESKFINCVNQLDLVVDCSWYMEFQNLYWWRQNHRRSS